MTKIDSEKATATAPETAVAGDVENQAAAPGGGVSNILRRWERDDLLKRGSLVGRGSGFLFSVLAFVIMVTNDHGDWKDFERYQEYRYVLALAILSSLYTGLQIFRQIREQSTGKETFTRQNSAIIDFVCDQIMAYLLLSASSSAMPLTNRMRENSNNIFTDSSASAIAFEFLAFIALALSALISGYKLSNQNYI